MGGKTFRELDNTPRSVNRFRILAVESVFSGEFDVEKVEENVKYHVDTGDDEWEHEGEDEGEDEGGDEGVGCWGRMRFW